MKKLTTYKADPLTREDEIEDVQIEFSKEMKTLTGDMSSFSIEEAQKRYLNEAEKIVEILYNHMPQGIRLRVAMLLMKSYVDDNLFIGNN